MKSLKTNNDFYLAMIGYMQSLNLFENEFKNIKRQFEAADDNNDGSLSVNELTLILENDLPPADYKALIPALGKIDSDNSGKIDYSEFVNLIISK